MQVALQPPSDLLFLRGHINLPFCLEEIKLFYPLKVR